MMEKLDHLNRENIESILNMVDDIKQDFLELLDLNLDRKKLEEAIKIEFRLLTIAIQNLNR